MMPNFNSDGTNRYAKAIESEFYFEKMTQQNLWANCQPHWLKPQELNECKYAASSLALNGAYQKRNFALIENQKDLRERETFIRVSPFDN